MNTYLTHPWVITDASGKCLAIYFPAAEPSRALVQAFGSSPGASEAEYRQGKAYYDSKDYAGALAWYRKASDDGSGSASDALSLMYSLGQGVRADIAQSVAWTRKAAEQGNADAAEELGKDYELGEAGGLLSPIPWPQDYAEAFKWFRQADDGNHGYARLHLGILYWCGLGTRKDAAQARLLWTQQAAQSPLSPAKDYLANGAPCPAGPQPGAIQAATPLPAAPAAEYFDAADFAAKLNRVIADRHYQFSNLRNGVGKTTNGTTAWSTTVAIAQAQNCAISSSSEGVIWDCTFEGTENEQKALETFNTWQARVGSLRGKPTDCSDKNTLRCSFFDGGVVVVETEVLPNLFGGIVYQIGIGVGAQ